MRIKHFKVEETFTKAALVTASGKTSNVQAASVFTKDIYQR